MTPEERDYRRTYAELLRLRAFEGTSGSQREDPVLRALDDAWERLSDTEQDGIKADIRAWAGLSATEKYQVFVASSVDTSPQCGPPLTMSAFLAGSAW